MKQVLETLFLAVSFVFMSWLVINAGVKFEVKIKGECYGISVGGMDELKKRELFIDRFFWSIDRRRDFIMVYDDIDGIEPQIFEDFIRTVFPSVVACTTTLHDNCIGLFIYLDLENSQYPNRPNYNYIPFPQLQQIYSVTKQS